MNAKTLLGAAAAATVGALAWLAFAANSPQPSVEPSGPTRADATHGDPSVESAGSQPKLSPADDPGTWSSADSDREPTAPTAPTADIPTTPEGPEPMTEPSDAMKMRASKRRMLKTLRVTVERLESQRDAASDDRRLRELDARLQLLRQRMDTIENQLAPSRRPTPAERAEQ